MCDARELKQFEVAHTWLRQFSKTARFYSRGTSYALKHICERENETYICNGVLIAAAIAEGFRIKPAGRVSTGPVGGNPYVFLNISPDVANEQEREERRVAEKRGR